MSWFRSKNSANDKGRKKHIQSLMSRNGRLYTVQTRDRNSYIISFKTRMGDTSITVALSDQFPDIAPRLFCDPKYSHPLIDANGNVIGIDELNKWTNYSDLGRIVQTVVMQFTASPPSLKAVSNPHQSHRVPLVQAQRQQPQGAAPSYQQHKNKAPPSYQQHLKQQQSVLDMRSIKISIPKKIPQLEQLSVEQIDEMVTEDKLIENFAYTASESLREMRKQQQQEVLRIANANLKKKEEITAKDKEIQALREEIDTLSQYYTNLKARQDKVLQKYSKQRINQELNKEIQKYDDQCTEIKDKFDEGDIAPVGFIKKYVKVRQKYHVVSIKKEKYNLF